MNESTVDNVYEISYQVLFLVLWRLPRIGLPKRTDTITSLTLAPIFHIAAKRWPISKGRELEIRVEFKRNGFAELYISSEGFYKPKVDVQVV